MNGFKKLLIASIAAGTTGFGVLSLAEPAQSGDHHHGGKKMFRHHGELRGSPVHDIKRMAAKLELSTEQQSEIKAIVEKSKEEAQVLREKMKANMQAERKAMEAQPSERELKKLARATADSRVDLMMHRFSVEDQVKKVLTKEQSERMQQLRDERKARFQERAEKHRKSTNSKE